VSFIRCYLPLLLVPEVGGVFGCSFGEGARGSAENLFHRTGVESRLPEGLGLQGQGAIGEHLGETVLDHALPGASGGIFR
jgi:hypothetical protein